MLPKHLPNFPPRLTRAGVFFVLIGFTLSWSLGQTIGYTIASGDTLSTIAGAHNTTVAELMRLNNLTSTAIYAGQQLQVPQAVVPAPIGVREHTVVTGETLQGLSTRYGISETSLRRSNPGLETALVDAPLIAGFILAVPPAEGEVIRLRSGENVLAVALRYGLSVSELARVNALSDVRSVGAGGLLFIPETYSQVVANSKEAVEVNTSATNAGATPSTTEQPSVDLNPKEQHLQQQMQLLNSAADLLASYDPAPQTLIWPLTGRLTSGYGRRNISVGGNTFHSGIDIGASPGTPIRAASSGVVSRAGWGGAYGYVVYVDHGAGRQTRYGHMSEILVRLGQRVAQGDTLGLVGSSGASTGPHLHFELRFEGRSVDPLGYLP